MDKSMVTYRLNFGPADTLIGYVWYIEGLKERILVDAGISSEYLSKKRAIPAKDIHSLESGLQKVGLTPDEIDLVIITHLHSDHVAQAHKFSKARFFIQKDELEFARTPHPAVADQKPGEFFEGINFEVVSGDAKIYDEVSVLFFQDLEPANFRNTHAGEFFSSSGRTSARLCPSCANLML